MNAKKKNQTKPPTAGPDKVRAGQGIRLKPSISDYATFVETTANAMGRNVPPASEAKANKRLLWLVNLES